MQELRGLPAVAMIHDIARYMDWSIAPILSVTYAEKIGRLRRIDRLINCDRVRWM